MEINLNDDIKKIISIFLLIILPLVLLISIVIINHIQPWYYYIILVTWFGIGIIFYSAIK